MFHSRFPQSMQEQLCYLLVKTTQVSNMFASHTASSTFMSACCLCWVAPHTFSVHYYCTLKICYSWKGCYVMKRQKNHWTQTYILCHTFCNDILFLVTVIRFSFLPSLTLVCFLMVYFSDISSGNWAVHEHVEPQPWAPWHVRARDEVFLRLEGPQQGRWHQQGYQASCEEEVVLSKSA